ncbi:MarR family transcriptional regulator [Romeria aff. gracilis LEGE 07310]|uniref:MarR family transcriptional regulator n=1 Tax=Vasconcelosia minhoensis LEGE 07310 TaxID=915328 RepID=A0A8J7DQR3_9CYAN|nr:MarR family transcriptional regulator [Romeria gracilis]MBE9076984.1 MarR family transcriptional regulator [Romeria aff. gracilis LEGE 07310]
MPSGTARAIAQTMTQQCIARRLRQVNRRVTRLYDDALRPYGLTVNQLHILAVVIDQGQIRPGQLGQILGMEKSTVSRTVDRMVKKAWLQIMPGQDGRTQLLSATPQGRQLLQTTAPVWETLQAGVLDSLSAGGQDLLQGLGLGHEGAIAAADDNDSFDAGFATDAADFYGN